jgi:hypothetical protein
MSIIGSFRPIRHGDSRYNFDHLQPFCVIIPARNPREPDITVRISYQSHVYSKQYDPHHDAATIRDENGTTRHICDVRYAASRTLPDTCKAMVLSNYLTWETKDRNHKSNLAVAGAELVSGPNTVVIYYLHPSRSEEIDVELVVKSSYAMEIDFKRIQRRFNVCQLVRKVHFEKVRLPQ